jgi:dihydrolipoamide dehydrogenase
LLGCHIIGSYASEIILSAASLIELRTKIADIKKIVFPHPTVCEIIREAVFALK